MPNPICNRRSFGGAYPNTSANFAQASSQSATIADNASMSGGSVEMSFAGWVKCDTVGTNMEIMGKYGASGTREYLLWLQGAGPLRWQVSSTGVGVTPVDSTNYGNVPVSTWIFVFVGVDGTNSRLSVNAGTINTAAFAATIFDGTQQFGFGVNDALLSFFNGQLDSWGFWKSAAAGGGALTQTQINKLYRSGVGMAYKDLDADLRTGLVSWWNFDGNLNDSHGTNHLTNNNGVTFVAGKR